MDNIITRAPLFSCYSGIYQFSPTGDCLNPSSFDADVLSRGEVCSQLYEYCFSFGIMFVSVQKICIARVSYTRLSTEKLTHLLV